VLLSVPPPLAAGAGGPYCDHSDLRLLARGGGAVDDRTISEVGSA